MSGQPSFARLMRSRYLVASAAALVSVGGIGVGRAALKAEDARAAARLAALAERSALEAEHAAFTEALSARRAASLKMDGAKLEAALTDVGAPTSDVTAALGAAASVFDIGRLREGQRVDYVLEEGDGAARLTALSFHSDPGKAVTISRLHDGTFTARELATPTQSEVAHIAAAIDGSFYASAVGAGATDREVAEVADVFAYDVDFQRDIRPGDAFEMVFEREFDELGRTVSTGKLMYVALNTRQTGAKAFYRFHAPGDAKSEWYDASGKAARKFLMRTPINGARLSSSFGMRRHPILGYSKLHRGADFAAPTGTPVFAAGEGVVTKASFNGGYGNYVAIRHDDKYATAYAHLSRFARGLRPGMRVRQGQVIGYVGSTGRSTGPHLHYEVMYRGSQINPLSLKVPTGRNLTGKALASFQEERRRIDALRQPHGGPPAVVAASFRAGTAR